MSSSPDSTQRLKEETQEFSVPEHQGLNGFRNAKLAVSMAVLMKIALVLQACGLGSVMTGNPTSKQKEYFQRELDKYNTKQEEEDGKQNAMLLNHDIRIVENERAIETIQGDIATLKEDIIRNATSVKTDLGTLEKAIDKKLYEQRNYIEDNYLKKFNELKKTIEKLRKKVDEKVGETTSSKPSEPPKKGEEKTDKELEKNLKAVAEQLKQMKKDMDDLKEAMKKGGVNIEILNNKMKELTKLVDEGSKAIEDLEKKVK